MGKKREGESRMRRRILLPAAAAALPLLGACSRADVGVIGGADGPTAVFVTGAQGALPALAAACAALAAVLLFLLLRRRKK